MVNLIKYRDILWRLLRRLPWQIALGALVLYGITSGHGVTINSLSLTAKVADWDWTPMIGHPLFWLLTLPLQLLPSAWVPLGLNFFFAVVAALTLGLLARTVQLMPWNWPLADENRWIRTLPVLLACSMCGLEFNFWQEATAASGEMLAFLPLATALWLMLEFRVHHKIRWIYAAALVWGLGMAENWLMLVLMPLFIAGTLCLKINSLVTKSNRMEAPLFVTAEFWLQRLHFFRFTLLKFLALVVGFGFAGFLIYTVLPLVNSLNPNLPPSHGEIWLASLKQTKNLVVPLGHVFWAGKHLLMLTLAVYFLVPILSCWMREPLGNAARKARFNPWADHHGRRRSEAVFMGIIQKAAGNGFEVWAFRILRVFLLLVCLWLAFDPKMGLRQIILQQLDVSMPLLVFDYLNALGAAFLIGDFLLLAQHPALPSQAGIPWRRWSALIPWRQLAIPSITGGLVLITAGLAVRNAPAIFNANFHPLQRFGELAVASLPAGCGVILSDQPQKLAVLQAALSQHPDRQDWLAVDTRILPLMEYRAWLEHRQPFGWLTDATRHELTPAETAQLLEQIAQTNRLFFLNPTYGYIFEHFFLEPTGAIYEMKLRGENLLEPRTPAPAATAANEAFWSAVWQKEIAPLVPAPRPPLTGWQKKIGYTPAPRWQNRLLANWYSLALDSCGVTLQRQGSWPEARRRFEQALQLNPNNYSAKVSLICNTNLQSGRKQALPDAGETADQLDSPKRLFPVINNYGPFDDPISCYLLALTLRQEGLLLQAVEQFERIETLAPGALPPKLVLAELYTQLHLTERERPLLIQLREATKNLPANNAVALEMSRLEADYWLSQTNHASASSELEAKLQKRPEETTQVASRVINAYLAFGDYTNALRLINAQLSRTPDDVHTLNSQAAILIQSGKAAAALPILDHILTLTNLPAARLNRANAQILCQNFAAAETDFRELQKSGTEPGRVGYGLAKIAEQRHDTNQAVIYFQACLTNLAPGTFLWRQATASLQALAPNPATNLLQEAR